MIAALYWPTPYCPRPPYALRNAPTVQLRLSAPSGGILKVRYASLTKFWLLLSVKPVALDGFHVVSFTCEVTMVLPYSKLSSTQLPGVTFVPPNMPYASGMRGAACNVCRD